MKKGILTFEQFKDISEFVTQIGFKLTETPGVYQYKRKPKLVVDLTAAAKDRVSITKNIIQQLVKIVGEQNSLIEDLQNTVLDGQILDL